LSTTTGLNSWEADASGVYVTLNNDKSGQALIVKLE
jgi:hypothetical protein